MSSITVPPRPSSTAPESEWREYLHTIIRWIEETLDAEGLAQVVHLRENLRHLLVGTSHCMQAIGALPSNLRDFPMKASPTTVGLIRQVVSVTRFALNCDVTTSTGFDDASLAFCWVGCHASIALQDLGAGRAFAA